MRYNLSITCPTSPPKGRLEVIDGNFAGMCILIGAGQWEHDRFTFADDGPCHIAFALETDQPAAESATVVKVTDTPEPLEFSLKDIAPTGSLTIPDRAIKITCEQDVWAGL